MDFFQRVLSSHNTNLELIASHPVAGGCINSTYRLETNQGIFFLKWNSSSQKDMILADGDALNYLSNHSPIRIPALYKCNELEGKYFLLTEWIEQGHADLDFWQLFGNQLAEQHQITHSHFGWEKDNFIGSLPQKNNPTTSWYEFFIHQRLLPQLKRAEKRNLIAGDLRLAFDRLFGQLENLIPDESPALLHGDLWSGNFLCDSDSRPVIFDPSIHFGHRETELAFTTLFGGFDEKFYANYQESFPLAPGFDQRKDIHNLYPLLVHVNLFGPSYLSGIKQTLKRFS